MGGLPRVVEAAGFGPAFYLSRPVNRALLMHIIALHEDCLHGLGGVLEPRVKFICRLVEKVDVHVL